MERDELKRDTNSQSYEIRELRTQERYELREPKLQEHELPSRGTSKRDFPSRGTSPQTAPAQVWGLRINSPLGSCLGVAWDLFGLCLPGRRALP